MSTNISTVLITGASSGIGLGLAQAFLKVGSNVPPRSEMPLSILSSSYYLGST